MLTLLKKRVEHVGDRWKHLYRCVCGKEVARKGSDVDSGRTKSCGCWNVRVTKARNTTHAMRYTAEYTTWRGMKTRCYNPNATGYEDYGGRGITVAAEWLDSFETFYKDMGSKPDSSYSIDRIDNNKGYSKDNCRWASKATQTYNRRNSKRRAA